MVLRAAGSRSLVLQVRTRSAQAAGDVLKARLPRAGEPRGPQHLEASPTTSQRKRGTRQAALGASTLAVRDLRQRPDTLVLKARTDFQVLLSSQPTGARSAHLTFDVE